MEKKIKDMLMKLFFTVLMIMVSLTMIIPFVWMISASFKNSADVLKVPIQWIPKTFNMKNYQVVWNIGDVAPREYHFALSYLNSLKVTLINLSGALITSSLAGYAFAKIKFRGSNQIFLLYLATMMIPPQITLIPKYIMFSWMGMMGTHLPIILPNLTTATGVFLMRQYFIGIPTSLREAARIDGASEFRIWANIMMPLAKPAVASLAVIVFMWHWNNYLEPLVFLSDWRTYTIPVNLTNFVDENITSYNLVMAASVSALVPMFMVFLFGQKFFVKGLTSGAVKG